MFDPEAWFRLVKLLKFKYKSRTNEIKSYLNSISSNDRYLKYM